MFDAFYIGSLIAVVSLFALTLFLFRKRKTWENKKTLFIWFWNASLIMFLLSLIFIGGETYYRFFVDRTDSYGISKIALRWKEKYYHFNNIELRDNIDYEMKIAPGKRRLTVIGDSFTAGHGIKNVDDRFANILRNKYPDLEVHVVAMNGASTNVQIEYLEQLKERGYQFDLVLLAYCLNDIDHLMEEAQNSYKRIHAFNSGLTYLQRESYFINILSFRWFASQDPDVLNYSGLIAEAYEDQNYWPQQKAFLLDLKNQCASYGAGFMVATFPFFQETIADYSFKQVHSKLKEFWKSQRVPHVDLLESFSAELGPALTVNPYDAHPNEKAHSIAAKAIDNFFRQEPEY